MKPACRDGVVLLEAVVAGKVEGKAGSTDGVAFGLVDAEGTFLHVDGQVGLSREPGGLGERLQGAAIERTLAVGLRERFEGGRPGVPSKLVQATRQGGPPRGTGAGQLRHSVDCDTGRVAREGSRLAGT